MLFRSGGLLPQWLSGWGFLFPSSGDLGRARELVARLPAGARVISLAYEAGDPLARAVAERIAVNARDAGIALHASPRIAGPDARLVALPIGTPDPAQALEELAAALGYEEWPRHATPEALYGAERTLLEGFRVAPLFHLPQDYGVSPRVRVWAPPAVGQVGGLRLADVWIDGARP